MERIRELRCKKGISQRVLADFMHTTQCSIHRYESGRVEPSLQMLIQMADFFDTTIDYIVGRYNGNKNQPVCFSSAELELLKIYRNLTKERQQAALLMINSLKRPV
jgi:transcriptional regulator with XRE-family HTH domain